MREPVCFTGRFPELSSCVWLLLRYLSMAESMEATDVSDPTLNFGVVVDCGSSGSRVFVYYWPPHKGNPHTLLDIRQMKDREHVPVVKKIKPGESTSGRVLRLRVEVWVVVEGGGQLLLFSRSSWRRRALGGTDDVMFVQGVSIDVAL